MVHTQALRHSCASITMQKAVNRYVLRLLHAGYAHVESRLTRPTLPAFTLCAFRAEVFPLHKPSFPLEFGGSVASVVASSVKSCRGLVSMAPDRVDGRPGLIVDVTRHLGT